MLFAGRDVNDPTRLKGELLTLDDLYGLSANGHNNGLTLLMVVVGYLAPWNKQSEHPAEVPSLVLMGQDFRSVGFAGSGIFNLDILYSSVLNNFITQGDKKLLFWDGSIEGMTLCTKPNSTS